MSGQRDVAVVVGMDDSGRQRVVTLWAESSGHAGRLVRKTIGRERCGSRRHFVVVDFLAVADWLPATTTFRAALSGAGIAAANRPRTFTATWSDRNSTSGARLDDEVVPHDQVLPGGVASLVQSLTLGGFLIIVRYSPKF
jgi:hypothetical protein